MWDMNWVDAQLQVELATKLRAEGRIALLEAMKDKMNDGAAEQCEEAVVTSEVEATEDNPGVTGWAVEGCPDAD